MINKRMVPLAKLWKAIHSNWPLKIISLLFAIFLWNYITVQTSPVRQRVFEGQGIILAGESVLQSNGLTLLDRETALAELVSVQLGVPLNNLTQLNTNTIRVSLDLSGIQTAGQHTVRLDARSNIGQVTSIRPDTITIIVEQRVTRTFPLVYNLENNLDTNYEPGTPTLSVSEVMVTGPVSLVNSVSAAVVTLPVNPGSELITESRPIQLLDSEGNPIENPNLSTDRQDSVVRLAVNMVKTVPVNPENVLGQDKVANGFKLSRVEFSPSEVTLVGSSEVLKGIEKIDIEPQDITGLSESAVFHSRLIVPSRVKLKGSDMVDITAVISPILDAKAFNMTARPVNLARGLKLAPGTNLEAKVQVFGPVNDLATSRASWFDLSVDLDGLGPGRHTLPVVCQIQGDYPQCSVMVQPPFIEVTLE